jgi:flagellar biosynthesis/type III secretory pathway M-ring protein FliF/YscJ
MDSSNTLLKTLGAFVDTCRQNFAVTQIINNFNQPVKNKTTTVTSAPNQNLTLVDGAPPQSIKSVYKQQNGWLAVGVFLMAVIGLLLGIIIYQSIVIKRLRGTSYQIKNADPFAVPPDEEIATPQNKKLDASNYQ